MDRGAGPPRSVDSPSRRSPEMAAGKRPAVDTPQTPPPLRDTTLQQAQCLSLKGEGIQYACT